MLHQFQDMMEQIVDRHAGVVTTMAEGVLELKSRLGREMIDTSVQFFLGAYILLPASLATTTTSRAFAFCCLSVVFSFLVAHRCETSDRLYMNRISIRMLITQHLELFKQAQATTGLCAVSGGDTTKAKKNRWVGIVDPQCNVREVPRWLLIFLSFTLAHWLLLQIAEDAASEARYLCSNNYSLSPAVEIIVPSKLSTQTTNSPTLPYVPAHLHHMLFELLKVREALSLSRGGGKTASKKVDRPSRSEFSSRGRRTARC